VAVHGSTLEDEKGVLEPHDISEIAEHAATDRCGWKEDIMTELEKLLADLSADPNFRLEDFKLFLGDSKDLSPEDISREINKAELAVKLGIVKATKDWPHVREPVDTRDLF
jgi:hypothetical protein